VRTPIGSFNGKLASFDAPKLGAIAVRAAVEQAGISKSDVQEVILGNVVQAGQGQAPARQAAIHAGLPNSVICTTVNKMCASGMKSVMFGAQGIMLGLQNCVVAGGFESMTNTPYYLPKVRQGLRLGDGQVVDGIMRDGLTDAYDNKPMGNCAEKCAKEFSISREDQDKYAIDSYKRAAMATEKGYFKNEIVSVALQEKTGTVMFAEDEEFKNIKLDKVPTLRPVFDKNGTVTAANASKISDGASALVLMSEEKAKRAGLKPLARILSFADAEKAPVDFTTAPSDAIPKALKLAGLNKKDIDYYEINEAFSVVSLANMKILDLDPSRVNVFGGAVSLGHPIGCSGARIITTLINVLRVNNGKIGVAGICNGGGGASSIVIERLE
jgi:acetyl-CoA C-acetyltransferase